MASINPGPSRGTDGLAECSSSIQIAPPEPLIPADVLPNVIAAAAAVAAALAAGFALVQARVARRGAHGERTADLLKEMDAADARTDRAMVWSARSEAFTNWDGSTIGAAERTATQLNQVAVLIYFGYVDIDPFLAMWGRRVVEMYAALEPLIDARRREWTSPEHWVYLEWLSHQARVAEPETLFWAQPRNARLLARSRRRAMHQSVSTPPLGGDGQPSHIAPKPAGNGDPSKPPEINAE